MSEIDEAAVPETLAVGYPSEKYLAKAVQIARTLSLPINNNAPNQLMVSDSLSLILEHHSPIYLSFIEKLPSSQSLASAGIIRACKPRPGMHIIDATAGWGKDALLLARFGAQVTMLERHPIMACLLANALEEYQNAADKELIDLRLFHEDALTYLNRLTTDQHPDIIYLDPMHPTRTKSALVKKNMQVLQQLIFGLKLRSDEPSMQNREEEICSLINLARQKVRHSVIVKWPQRSPALLSPHSSIPGKTIRFDRYLKK